MFLNSCFILLSSDKGALYGTEPNGYLTYERNVICLATFRPKCTYATYQHVKEYTLSCLFLKLVHFFGHMCFAFIVPCR